MNEMIYLAHLTKLNECTKVKEAEKSVREFNTMIKSDTNVLSPYYKPICDEHTIKFIYKLYVKSINVYTGLSKAKLPDFLYDDRFKVQKQILEHMLRSEKEKSQYSMYKDYVQPFSRLVSYTEFIDIFEFDTKIKLPGSSYFVEQLNTIIGNNAIHFDIEFNYHNDAFDNNSTSIMNNKFKELLYGVRYKQVNFPNKAQTVWDKFIVYLTSEANKYQFKSNEFNESIIKLEQQIEALKAVKEMYNA